MPVLRLHFTNNFLTLLSIVLYKYNITMDTIDTRTPVTILTGFLGAGKTTLLNQIIEQNKTMVRLAIIENEVGDINIDSDLIVGADDDVFQITDGCLCCTLNLELAKLLASLIRRRGEYDHLIIETTGIANPSAVQPFLWAI